MSPAKLLRRDVLKNVLAAPAAAGLTSAAAVPGPGAQARVPEHRSELPEVLVVSKLPPSHTMIRSFVSQLLERGIYFEHNERQELPSVLPKDLSQYRVIALDPPAYDEVIQQAETIRRLEKYITDQGLLFRLFGPSDGTQVSAPGYDTLMHEQAGIMIAHGRLTEANPALERRQLARSDESILEDVNRAILQRASELRGWGEFNNHYWRPAVMMAEKGNAEAREIVLHAVRECSRELPTGVVGQNLAGLWGTAWLFRETGEREPMEKALRILDRVLTYRPRAMAVLTLNGFLDDPLGLRRLPADRGMGWEQPTVAMRTLNWNEALHMHCGSLAAFTRVGLNPRYLEEALRLTEHCARYHLDRRDNLLFHATWNGKPATGKWGRGHTHALYGLMFTAEEMEAKDPRRQEILNLVARVGEGLRKVQDLATGLWRNEVTVPLARVETSCAAGIVYVYGRCIAEGWLPRARFEDMVFRAWDGLKRMYWRQGLAAQCRGTAIGTSTYYLSRPQGWAPVPQLAMAALIVSRLRRGAA